MRDMFDEKFIADCEMLKNDPRKFVNLMTRRIQDNPKDCGSYFSRHHGWLSLGRKAMALDDPDAAMAMKYKALDDLNPAMSLKTTAVQYLARGNILASLGRHQDAVDDFAKGQAMNPENWDHMWGPLYQASSHAYLGHEQEALAACDRLFEDHWTPGSYGAPRGDKQDVIAEIRRRLAEVRGTKG